jgi:type II secretory pathway pseudopilin PulG
MIELLCVVAIIGVLAAIAIPNFLEAQIRSKTSRARMELMGLKVAIGDYYGTWRAYPPPIQIPDEEEKPAGQSGQVMQLDKFAEANQAFMAANPGLTIATGSGLPPTPTPVQVPPPRPPGWLSPLYNRQPYVSNDPWEKYPSPLQALTTPVAFVYNLPNDPFHRIPTGYGPYKYFPHLGEDGEGLRIDIPGLRGSFLFTLSSYGPDLVGDTVFAPDLTRLLAYDPTNGTTSSGDLLLSGP